MVEIIQNMADVLRECDDISYWDTNELATTIYNGAVEPMLSAMQNRIDDEAMINRGYRGKIALLESHLRELVGALERIRICRQDSGSLTTSDLLLGCVSVADKALAKLPAELRGV